LHGPDYVFARTRGELADGLDDGGGFAARVEQPKREFRLSPRGVLVPVHAL
jgi:hypothetical protein